MQMQTLSLAQLTARFLTARLVLCVFTKRQSKCIQGCLEDHMPVQADGTRYLLLINTLGTYLMDRSFRVRRVQMRFPCPGLKARHHCTLLDGEMVFLAASPASKS